MTIEFFCYLKTLIKCKYSYSIALLVYKRSFSWPQNVLQKRLDSFLLVITWAHKNRKRITLYYITFHSSKLRYLRRFFRTNPLLLPFRFYGIGRKSLCCCTEHSIQVYRTVSISDISLPWLKMKKKRKMVSMPWRIIFSLVFDPNLKVRNIMISISQNKWW